MPLNEPHGAVGGHLGLAGHPFARVDKVLKQAGIKGYIKRMACR
jgi:hypothetical protein